MSELSREQVERLQRPCECGHEPDQHGSMTGCFLCAEEERDPWCMRSFLDLLHERLAPMLDEARAEVVRDVEALIPPVMPSMVEHEGGFSHGAGLQCDLCPNYPHAYCVNARRLRATLAHHTPSAAAGAPLSDVQATSGHGQRDGAEKPANGRTVWSDSEDWS